MIYEKLESMGLADPCAALAALAPAMLGIENRNDATRRMSATLIKSDRQKLHDAARRSLLDLPYVLEHLWQAVFFVVKFGYQVPIACEQWGADEIDVSLILLLLTREQKQQILEHKVSQYEPLSKTCMEFYGREIYDIASRVTRFGVRRKAGKGHRGLGFLANQLPGIDLEDLIDQVADRGMVRVRRFSRIHVHRCIVHGCATRKCTAECAERDQRMEDEKKARCRAEGVRYTPPRGDHLRNKAKAAIEDGAANLIEWFTTRKRSPVICVGERKPTQDGPQTECEYLPRQLSLNMGDYEIELPSQDDYMGSASTDALIRLCAEAAATDERVARLLDFIETGGASSPGFLYTPMAARARERARALEEKRWRDPDTVAMEETSLSKRRRELRELVTRGMRICRISREELQAALAPAHEVLLQSSK